MNPGQRHRYNGIMAQPGGYVAQFKMDYIPAGSSDPLPIILTVASYDPKNLGTYDPETGKHLLSLENIRNRAYLLSARPAAAPFIEFQNDIIDHFKVFHSYSNDLNLLGRTRFISQDGKDFYFGQYLSKHVSYALIQTKYDDDPFKCEYCVLRRYGPGKLKHGGSSYYPIEPWEIQDFEALAKGKCPAYTKFVSNKINGARIFSSTSDAHKAIMQDFGIRFTNLWNMKHASGGRVLGLLSDFNDHRRKGGLETLILSSVLAVSTFSVANYFISPGASALAALLVGTSTVAGDYTQNNLSSIFRRVSR